MLLQLFAQVCKNVRRSGRYFRLRSELSIAQIFCRKYAKKNKDCKCKIPRCLPISHLTKSGMCAFVLKVSSPLLNDQFYTELSMRVFKQMAFAKQKLSLPRSLLLARKSFPSSAASSFFQLPLSFSQLFSCFSFPNFVEKRTLLYSKSEQFTQKVYQTIFLKITKKVKHNGKTFCSLSVIKRIIIAVAFLLYIVYKVIEF